MTLNKRLLTALLVGVYTGCGGTALPDHAGRAESGESMRPKPDSRPLDTTTGLRVATWNLEWLNRKDQTGPTRRSEEDYARLRAYADRLDAHVIALQEIDGVEAARRVFDPAKYELYVTAQGGSQRTGFAYRRGLTVSVQPDYVALDVGQVRAGADIVVQYAGHSLRMLSVHLKSGCFDEPVTSQNKDCRKLFLQLPVLEEWIDARGREGTLAVVLGDFNRRLFGRAADPFWQELDDADPPASDLWSPTEGQQSKCWGGSHTQFIDHIVFNEPAAKLAIRDSFAQLLYDSRDAEHKSVLSDHCPLTIRLASQPVVASAAKALTRAVDAGKPLHEGRIKGNIAPSGRKLYHLPGCGDYARTQIDETKGERWFDTEREAEAAGFARSANCRR